MIELLDNDIPSNFHGVWIDRLVWKNKDLSWLEKCIMSEIHWLSQQSESIGAKGCWASNAYLAKLFQCSQSTISKSIAKFIALGYIEQISFNGRQRILKSLIVTTLMKKGA